MEPRNEDDGGVSGGVLAIEGVVVASPPAEGVVEMGEDNPLEVSDEEAIDVVLPPLLDDESAENK